MVFEVNFDALPGPSHHYGAHAYGNIAAMAHKEVISRPKKCALQGLKKMKRLMELGIPQAVLPPQMRPSIETLRTLGFQGRDVEILQKAAKSSPKLLYEVSSSSAMWAANIATLSPSTDTQDGRLHITIANLLKQFHRSIEAEETFRLFRFLFADETLFAVHPPLPKGGEFGDEGSANHIRFCQNFGEKGIHLFVYGKSAFDYEKHRFPFRQAREASEAVARRHGLNPDSTFFVRQNPSLIEKGVFHNDVISTGHRTLFLYHEKAFIETEKVIQELKQRSPLNAICVTEEMLAVNDAIETYLFNSQLVTLSDHSDLMIAPKECERLNLDWLPLKVEFVDITESMQNGGGPACLRLPIVMNEQERAKVHPHIFLNENLYQKLVDWVERHYRDTLSVADLKDPVLLEETKTALDKLTDILHLGSFYAFQRETTPHPY